MGRMLALHVAYPGLVFSTTSGPLSIRTRNNQSTTTCTFPNLPTSFQNLAQGIEQCEGLNVCCYTFPRQLSWSSELVLQDPLLDISQSWSHVCIFLHIWLPLLIVFGRVILIGTWLLLTSCLFCGCATSIVDGHLNFLFPFCYYKHSPACITTFLWIPEHIYCESPSSHEASFFQTTCLVGLLHLHLIDVCD